MLMTEMMISAPNTKMFYSQMTKPIMTQFVPSRIARGRGKTRSGCRTNGGWVGAQRPPNVGVGGGSGDKHREFPSPHPNREGGREGRLTRLNLASRKAGQIDTLMRFTDEGAGGGDNSFVPLAGLCQAKCIRTRKVRPKHICTDGQATKTNCQVFQIGPVVHKSSLKDFCRAIIKERERGRGAKRLTSLLLSEHFIADWGKRRRSL